jgi:dihydrofolate reductase
MIRAILAHDKNWGIGKAGTLPWPHNPDDLNWFKECTADGIVVMGRKTWESLPKPHGVYGGKDVCKIVTDVIQARYTGVKDIWIIGGAQLVESCLPVIDELWLNNVDGDYNCDVFLPSGKITGMFKPNSVEIKSFGIITKWTKK